jgi:hypothetical protein
VHTWVLLGVSLLCVRSAPGDLGLQTYHLVQPSYPTTTACHCTMPQAPLQEQCT